MRGGSGQIEDDNADSLSSGPHALIVRGKLDVLILPLQKINGRKLERIQISATGNVRRERSSPGKCARTTDVSR